MKENLKKYLPWLNLYHLFCIAFGAFAFISVVATTHLNPLHSFFGWSSVASMRQNLMLFCFIMFWLKNPSPGMKKSLCFLILPALFLISSRHSGTQNFLSILIFVFYVSDEDIKVIITSLGIGTLLGILATIGSVLLGIIPNIVTEGTRIRQAWGFGVPVLLSGFYLNVGYVYLYLQRKKLTIIKLVVLLLPAVWIYLVTDGRMSFFSLILVSLLCYIFTKINTHRKKIANILAIFSIFTFITSFFLIIILARNLETNQFVGTLNSFSTGRISWAATYLDIYSPSFWGQSIARVGVADSRIIGQPVMVLDNAFLTMLLEQGVFVLLVTTIALFALINYLRKKEDVVSLVIWSIIILTFSIGNNSLYFWRNPLIFQFVYLIRDWDSRIIKRSDEVLGNEEN